VGTNANHQAGNVAGLEVGTNANHQAGWCRGDRIDTLESGAERMDPANKILILVVGGVALGVTGLCTWLVLRGKKLEREQAAHAKAEAARVKPQTPPRRPETPSADASSSPRPSSAAAPEASTQATAPASTSSAAPEAASASEPVADVNESAANQPQVIVDNRRKCYAVPPGGVIELQTPVRSERCAFVASRSDVAVHVIEEQPNKVRLSLEGPSGPVKVALLEPNESVRGHRVLSNWKFDLRAA